MRPTPRIALLLLSIILAADFTRGEEPTHPTEIEFKRQAVRRMVFDTDQAIPLASLRPAKVHDLDLMHPEIQMEGQAKSEMNWQLDNGTLIGKTNNISANSLRWVGGFNPFATYDLTVKSITGTGSTGIAFQNAATGYSLTTNLHFEKGKPTSIIWDIQERGKSIAQTKWPLPKDTVNENLTLRVQMAAVGVNILLESSGRSELIGYTDFSEHFDLRETKQIRHFNFGIATTLTPTSELTLAGASAALTPGSGQADIRAITDSEGNALIDDDRLWFTITVRGRALPHPLQGVFSLNPSIFDVKFEGIIVFDMGDGLLRNELASHLFLDSKSGEWRGWTTGFSALGGAGREEKKTILAVSSTRDPRKGFSVMKAKPVGIEGAHEDPHGVYDKEARKWRLLLCEKHKKYQAGMWESDHWDHGYERLAGPVPMDSTGTMIQSFDGTRYALYGSADRTVYIATYPDLKPAGELNITLPPWNDETGTRIWPNIIPLPQGYPAPYIALMMDRVNFPGMPTPNWTYGALYLYHGYPKETPISQP